MMSFSVSCWVIHSLLNKPFFQLLFTENSSNVHPWRKMMVPFKSLVLFNKISLLHPNEFLSNLNGVCSVIKISYLRTVKVRPVCLIVLFMLNYVFHCPLLQHFFYSKYYLSWTTPSPVRAKRKGLSFTLICILEGLKMQTLETLTPVETVRSRFILLHICRTFAPQ